MTDLKTKAVVLSAVKALVSKDRRLLEETMNAWSEEAADLLVVWCIEAITKLWITFDERDLFGLKSHEVPLAVLKASEAICSSRSQLKSRVALHSVLDKIA